MRGNLRRVALGILAGLAWVCSGILEVAGKGGADAGTAMALLVEGLFAAGIALVALLLMAVHSEQRERDGRVGLITVWAFAIAALVQVAGIVSAQFGGTSLDFAGPATLLVVLLSLIVYGIVTWRGKVFPRWMAVGMMLALPVTLALGEYGGNILFGGFWVAVGFAPRAASPANA